MIDRQKVMDRIHAEMNELEGKLETLRVKANLGKMDARDRFKELEKTFKEKSRPARTKLKELSSDSSEAWKDLAAGCEASWKEAKQAIQSAIAQFKD